MKKRRIGIVGNIGSLITGFGLPLIPGSFAFAISYAIAVPSGFGPWHMSTVVRYFVAAFMVPACVWGSVPFVRYMCREAPIRLAGTRVLMTGRLVEIVIRTVMWTSLAVSSTLRWFCQYVIGETVAHPSDCWRALRILEYPTRETVGLYVLIVLWLTILLFSVSVCWRNHKNFHDTTGQPFALFLRRFSGLSDFAGLDGVMRALPGHLRLVMMIEAPPGRFGRFWSLIGSSGTGGNWNPFSVGFAGINLRHPLKSIPVYVIAPANSWQQSLRHLVRKARCIIFDVSETSESTDIERDTIDSELAGGRTLCLECVDSSRAPDRRVSGSPLTIAYKVTWSSAITSYLIGVFVFILFASAIIPAFSYLRKLHEIIFYGGVFLVAVVGYARLLWVPALTRESLRSLTEGVLLMQSDIAEHGAQGDAFNSAP